MLKTGILYCQPTQLMLSQTPANGSPTSFIAEHNTLWSGISLWAAVQLCLFPIPCAPLFAVAQSEKQERSWQCRLCSAVPKTPLCSQTQTTAPCQLLWRELTASSKASTKCTPANNTVDLILLSPTGHWGGRRRSWWNSCGLRADHKENAKKN